MSVEAEQIGNTIITKTWRYFILNYEAIVDNALPGSTKWLGIWEGTMALINTKERTYTRPPIK